MKCQNCTGKAGEWCCQDYYTINILYFIAFAIARGRGTGGGGGGARKNEKMCPFFDWMCALFVLSSVPLIFKCQYFAQLYIIIFAFRSTC